MPLFILVAVACATLFFRAAYHERMNPWIWSVSSLGVTGIFAAWSGAIGTTLLAQLGLFGAMWWYNARRQDKKPG